MGWWLQSKEGHSFSGLAEDEDGKLMSWGDGVADVMDSAIAAITEEFENQIGRKPRKSELRAGLEFSLGGIPEEAVPA